MLGAVMLVGASAFAATHHDDPNNQIVITGSVDVRSGAVVDRVLIFDGDSASTAASPRETSPR